jgi:hypothetical protein
MPLHTSREAFEANWDRIFKKVKEHFDEKDGVNDKAGDTADSGTSGRGGEVRDDVAPDIP